MKYISYDGGGEAIASLLGGNADVRATDVSGSGEYLKPGKVRILSVSSPDIWTKRYDARCCCLKNVEGNPGLARNGEIKRCDSSPPSFWILLRTGGNIREQNI